MTTDTNAREAKKTKKNAPPCRTARGTIWWVDSDNHNWSGSWTTLRDFDGSIRLSSDVEARVTVAGTRYVATTTALRAALDGPRADDDPDCVEMTLRRADEDDAPYVYLVPAEMIRVALGDPTDQEDR